MLAEAGKSKFGNLFNLKNSLLALSILLAGFHLFLSLANHYFIRTFTYDYGVYNFAFYDFAHFRVSPCPLYMAGYPVTFLQDHFSLTLVFLSPCYWLLSWLFGTYTLLILQWAFVTFGAYATYQLILLKSDRTWLATLSFVFYFLLIGRFAMLFADCNLVVFGSAMMPAFIYYFEKGKTLQYLLCFFFLVFVREDYSLWLAFVALFLMIANRKDKKKLRSASLILISSVILFIMMFKIFIPLLEDENKKYNLFNFMALGKNPGEALSFVISHPWRSIELLFVNHTNSNYYGFVKTEFYFVYLVSGGILLLLRPAFLLPFIPLIAKKMYNDEPLRWSIESYYSVEVATILPLFVFLVLAGMKRDWLKAGVSVAVCAAAISISIHYITLPQGKRQSFTNFYKSNFLSGDFYKSDLDIKAVKKAVHSIPDDAGVSASGRICQYLAYRKDIYFFPTISDATYMLVIKKGEGWPIPAEDQKREVEKCISSGEWMVKENTEDFYLLTKK